MRSVRAGFAPTRVGVHPACAQVKSGEVLMGRVLRYLVLLLVLGAAVGAIYAMVADLPPPTRTVEIELSGAAME
jgi:hypothetical protein